MTKIGQPNPFFSDELKLIYRLLYPNQEFSQFIERNASAIPTPFYIGFNDLPLELQSLEPDYELRQFLYFLKPSFNFRAFKESVKSWTAMGKVFKGLNAYDASFSSAIPLSSLLKTAVKILLLLERHFETEPLNKLFPEFHGQAVSKTKGSDTENRKNPMHGKGCTIFPLYSIALSELRPAENASDLDIQDHQRTTTCSNLLIAAIYICASERRVIPIDPKQDFTKEQIEKAEIEMAYRNPYTFFSKEFQSAPDISILRTIDRIIRNARDYWHTISPAKKEQLRRIINRPYEDLAYVCSKVLLNPIFDNSGDEPLEKTIGDLKVLLQFFSETRKVRRRSNKNGGGNNSDRAHSPGDHIWELPPSFVRQEEDVYGNPVEAITLPVTPISQDRFDELKALGEDPYEDTYGDPVIEILFMEEAFGSQLKLDKHTSHTQLLLASKNQALPWDQADCTHEEMNTFMSFMRSKDGLAPKVLILIAILAIDLEMALKLEIGPPQSYNWLKGQSNFQFASTGYSDHLRACFIDDEGKGEFPVWVYPIPIWALKEHAGIRDSSKYTNHLSALTFTDYSEMAKIFINKRSDQPVTTPIPAFSDQEKIDIPKQCALLIQEFNQHINSGITLTKGKRNISIEKIRRYSKNYLIDVGFDPLLVEALDHHVSNSLKPALHYFTAPLWQLPKYSRHGLQYHLANRTSLFRPYTAKKLPGIANHTIGAAGLVKPVIVKTLINSLIKDIRNQPNKITSKKELEQFMTCLNAYSLYMALWFCIETSHRPHHTPFGDVNQIDVMHGLIKLRDKSDPQGGKFRLAWLSEDLRSQMIDYAYTISTLISWASHQDIEIDADLLIYLEPDKNSSNHFCIKPFTSQSFAKKIRDELDIEPNFYRKCISNLLKEGSNQISTQDIGRWLGHWVPGTAPYHLFSTASSPRLIGQLQDKIRSVITDLGFIPIAFELPQFELHVGKPRTRKTSDA